MFAVCDHEIVMVIGAMLSNFLQNHLSTSVQTQKEWIVGFMVGGEQCTDTREVLSYCQESY